MSHAALVEAVQDGNQFAALRMLAADARLCTDEDEPSALMLALYGNLHEVARAILARRLHLTPYEAASVGNVDRLLQVLSRDRGSALAFAADGFTALHLASFFGQDDAAAMLLRAGADPNAVAGNAASLRPLHAAAAGGHVRISELLLQAGANPNHTQQGGYVALHAAALRGCSTLADLLISHGARVDAVANDGRTPAVIAEQAGFTELAERLRRQLGHSVRR